jgi:hypothetical protein
MNREKKDENEFIDFIIKLTSNASSIPSSDIRSLFVVAAATA